jgi:hypothetical protein
MCRKQEKQHLPHISHSSQLSQYALLAALVLLYAFMAFAMYTWLPQDLALSTQTGSFPLSGIPSWQLGLINAAIILVAYSALGSVGLWLSQKLDWPGSYRASAGWRGLFFHPLLLGIGCGLFFVALDQLFTMLGTGKAFPHPPFPGSLLASASAGVGEEILFRLFVLGLWALILHLLLRRWVNGTITFWIANVIAALAFAAAHLPAIMFLLGVSSPTALPVPVLLEIFLLNGIFGLIAGVQYRRNGLLAASGVHFWTDIVWHVVFPLLKLSIY